MCREALAAPLVAAARQEGVPAGRGVKVRLKLQAERETVAPRAGISLFELSVILRVLSRIRHKNLLLPVNLL